jgi:hypothetical protein
LALRLHGVGSMSTTKRNLLLHLPAIIALLAVGCSSIGDEKTGSDEAQMNDAPPRLELINPQLPPATPQPKPKIVKIEVVKSTEVPCDFAAILASARGKIDGKPAPTTIPFSVTLDRAALNLPDNAFTKIVTGATVSGTIDYGSAPDLKITGIKATATLSYRSLVVDFDTTITAVDGANAIVPAKGGGKITDVDFKLEASGLGGAQQLAYDGLVAIVKGLGILPGSEIALNAKTKCFKDTYKFTTEGGATFNSDIGRGEIAMVATWETGNSMPIYVTISGAPGSKNAVVVRQNEASATPTVTIPAK